MDVYASERNRLLFSDKTAADQARLRQEVVACWPFAPELLNLLEDNILMADAAQGNRDLIRTLAEVYRERGDNAPVLTPADFSIDDDSCGVLSLLDAMAASADQEQLREKARRNLQALRDAAIPAPHALGVVSALWMRSLSAAHDAGGTRQEVQLDVTGRRPVDDNSFTAELAEIVDNSFNIHEVGTTEKRYCFKLPENPVSKVKAWARNDRSFEPETAATAYASAGSQGPGVSPHGSQLPAEVARLAQPATVRARSCSTRTGKSRPGRTCIFRPIIRRSGSSAATPVLIVLPVASAGYCNRFSGRGWSIMSGQPQHGPVPAAQGRPAEHLRRPRPDYYGPLCHAGEGVGRVRIPV